MQNLKQMKKCENVTELDIKITCKGTGKIGSKCEYDSMWFCKHPNCKSLVLTSNLMCSRPTGCPKNQKWRSI